jgi:hypothetical protein
MIYQEKRKENVRRRRKETEIFQTEIRVVKEEIIRR